MRLLGFVTHRTEIQALIPDTARAVPQKPIDRFFDIHGKIPFVEAAETQTSYDTDAMNQVRPASEGEFDQRMSW